MFAGTSTLTGFPFSVIAMAIGKLLSAIVAELGLALKQHHPRRHPLI
jgi:hypothetical protein